MSVPGASETFLHFPLSRAEFAAWVRLRRASAIVYDLPGAASLGIMTTYLSDNPAILGLAEDTNFRKYFKKYQLPALTNLGTAFGMGLIVTTFMLGISLPGENVGMAALIGNVGAIIGSIISVRIMMLFTKKVLAFQHLRY